MKSLLNYSDLSVYLEVDILVVFCKSIRFCLVILVVHIAVDDSKYCTLECRLSWHCNFRIANTALWSMYFNGPLLNEDVKGNRETAL